MSYQPLWLRDLVAYSIQAAALVGVGIILARALRLRVPKVRHAYWQALLALCVFLPLLQPWHPEVLDAPGFAMSNITLAPTEAAAPSGPSVAEIVLWVVCAGIALRVLWMALGLGRLWFYRRRAERINQTPEAVREAQRLAPASSSFFISRQIPTPATFGFFHPAILFPARFLEMEPAMQKAIALHELLHVERRDWLWNMFEEIVLTLLWFHVPLWWVVRSARLSREQVVDAEAVRRSNARRPYLKALLEMAGQKRLAESLPAPLFLRENQLAERVALMMKEVHMSRTRLTVSILTAAVTLLIAGAALVWAFPLKTSAPQPETPAVVSPAAQSSVSDTSETSLPANAPLQETDSSQKLGKVYKVGGNVKAPDPVYMPNPPYTPEARKNHLTGTVVLSCVVDTKGRVVEVKERSEPLGQGLDENAIDTVRNWKFKPGTRNGVPVPVRVQAEVTFKLYDKQGEDSAKPDPHPNSQSQVKRPTPEASKESSQEIKINQAEIQRQALEREQAAAKLDRAKANKQALEQEQAAASIDRAKIQHKMQESMKQLEKLNTAEMQRHMQEQMKQLEKMNTPEMRQKMEEAMKQLKAAKIAVPKIDEAKIRRQVEQAMMQAKIAQESADKVNKAEIQRQLEQARKEIKQARQEAQAARKEAEKAREELRKERLELQKQRKEVRPLPSAPALAPAPPAPPSADQLPSPAPPALASPAAPPVLPSADAVPPPPPASPVPPPPPQPQN